MASVTHYASLLVDGEEVYGVATLIAGGYSFRPEGSRAVRLVSSKDVNLMLYGLCDLADAQYIADELRGGPVGVCLSRLQEVA